MTYHIDPASVFACQFPTHKNFRNLTGQRFGRLLVVEFAGKRAAKTQNKYVWRCNCDCGAIFITVADNLKNGFTRSCGCLSREVHAALMTTHGLHKAPERFAYSMMIQRCLNPNNKGYKNYGGRGITICERWLGVDGFKNFLEDMGRRKVAGLTIERRNNNGNYCKENCYWASRKVQARNRRDNHPITLNGKTMIVTEWAEELGIPRGIIFGRLQLGWSGERALTEPIHTTRERTELGRYAKV